MGGGDSWTAVIQLPERGGAAVITAHSRSVLTKRLQTIYRAPVFMEPITTRRDEAIIKQIRALLSDNTNIEDEVDCDFETYRTRLLRLAPPQLRGCYNKLKAYVEADSPGFAERGNRPGWGTYRLTHSVPCSIKQAQTLWDMSPWKARGMMKELNDRGLVRYAVNGRKRQTTSNGVVHYGGTIAVVYGLDRSSLDTPWVPDVRGAGRDEVEHPAAPVALTSAS